MAGRQIPYESTPVSHEIPDMTAWLKITGFLKKDRAAAGGVGSIFKRGRC